VREHSQSTSHLYGFLYHGLPGMAKLVHKWFRNETWTINYVMPECYSLFPYFLQQRLIPTQFLIL